MNHSRLLAIILALTALTSLCASALAEDESVAVSINCHLTLDGEDPGTRKFAFKLWKLSYEQMACFYPAYFIKDDEWPADMSRFQALQTDRLLNLAHTRMLAYLDGLPHTIVYSDGTKVPMFNETLYAVDIDTDTTYPLNFVITAVDDPDDNVQIDDMIYSVESVANSYYYEYPITSPDDPKGILWKAISIQGVSTQSGYFQYGGDELDNSDVPGYLLLNHTTFREPPATGDETPLLLLGVTMLTALTLIRRLRHA